MQSSAVPITGVPGALRPPMARARAAALSMEPLSIQSGVSQTVRPVMALDANLTAVLREGRTVAGEVLQTLGGKGLLIGLGRHRVPAQSQVELMPGERFLARVEHTAEGTRLRVLGQHGGKESSLVVALRGAVGDDRPVGELLKDLGAALRGAIEQGGDPGGKLQRLMKSLGEHIFVPGSNGAELSELLSRAGLDHEAILAQLASAGTETRSLALAREFAAKLLGVLQAALASAGATLDKQAMGQLRRLTEGLLVQLLGSSQPGASSASLSRSFARQLAGLFGGLPDSPARQALLAALPGALSQLLGGDPPSKLGQALLAAFQKEATVRLLQNNLKGKLLAGLADLAPGAARDALQRTLRGLEAEQLFNLARKEFVEGWQLSLPVPDGDGFATAQLFYRDSEAHEGDAERGEHELQRLTLSVDFSRLGPLRAELGVREDFLALRLSVTRPEIQKTLEAALEELSQQLSKGAREVRVSVVLCQEEEVRCDALHQDIRWLQDNHLCDLNG